EELLGQVEGTIGVIVPLPPEESAQEPAQRAAEEQPTLFDELAQDGPAQHGSAPPAAWTAADRERIAAGLPERVQVLDVLEAKGLEFDAAVIVAPETIATQSPRGLRVLYVAVSRATQRLTVLTADPGWCDTLLTD